MFKTLTLHWRLVVAALVLMPALGAAAWRLADLEHGMDLVIVLGIGGLFGLLSLIGLVGSVASGDPRDRANRKWFALGTLLSATWVVAGLLGRSPAGTTVYVENFSGRDVTLELDGRPWIRADDGTSQQAAIPFGVHEVVTRSADGTAELDRRQVEAKQVAKDPLPKDADERDYPYIFNVLGAQTYLKGKV